jgi:hypothetical protein
MGVTTYMPMKYSLFWDVTLRSLVDIDVSGRPISPIFMISWSA